MLNSDNKKAIIYVSIIIAIILIVVIGCLAYISAKQAPTKQKGDSGAKTDQSVCPMDAKQCSDGSYVGRSGPNCEFVCPEKQTGNSVEEQNSGQTGGNTGIANPASTYCVEHNGTSEIRTNPDGSQVGYCVFPNNKECEEWALMRGECKP